MVPNEEEQFLRDALLAAFKKQGYLEKEQLKDLRFLLGGSSKIFRSILRTTLNYKKKQRIIRRFGPRSV